MEVNPIAVILVYMDSKGDRLLYRYPYQQQQQQQQQQHQQQQQSATQQKQYKTQSSQSQQTTIVEKLDNSSETIITTITTTTTNSISELKPNLVTNILKESIIRKRNPYAVTNTDDLLQTPPQTSNKICIKQGQLQGLEDRMLSTLLAVKQQLCHQKFELKINDVRFVSHPTLVPRKERNLLLTTTTTTTNSNNDADNDIDTNSNNNNNINLDDNNDLTTIQTTTTTTTTINHKQPQQVLINVVFALHAQANYSIVKCYHKLSKKLGVVLRVEEQRIGYLSEETLQMARTHDEMSTQQQPLERIFDVISERSSLAQAMKTIYHDLCTTGVISLTLNQTKTLAFCMPQKAHQLHKKGSLVDPDAIRSCLRLLKPYHGMLLLVDFAELLDCVPPPGVRMLWQLIEVYTPLSSLQNMASDADIGIENVYKIVSHLVYWAKATIIYPLCETNVYVIAPDAALHTRSHLVEKFATRFAGMSLFEAIEDFSLPTSIGHLTTPLQQPARQGILVQMVLWMLQHHLLIQLHTYVQFMTCTSDNGNGGLLHEHLCMELDNGVNGEQQHKNEQRNLLRPLSLLHLDDMADMSYTNRCHLDDDDNNINVSSSLLSMSSQPLPVPDHALRHSITETDTAYSADGSTVSDNIAAMPSSSHKSNYSMTASVSTENCESIDSIEDEEKIKELLQIFDESDAIAIRQIPASNNLDDLTLLVKLYQAGYFKSEHHLEEIMYFENLRRSQLLQLLDKFREVLIIYETEDPAIASMYNNK